MWSQYPHQFEFNEAFLIFVMVHLPRLLLRLLREPSHGNHNTTAHAPHDSDDTTRHAQDSVYSHQFGNFLADNERARVQLKIERETNSLWSFIGGFKKPTTGTENGSAAKSPSSSSSGSSMAELCTASNKALFLNPLLLHAGSTTTTTTGRQPLVPHVKRVKWWGAYFLRWKCNANLKGAIRRIYREKTREDDRQEEDEDEQVLDLRGQGLHIIPPEMGALRRVTDLDLRGNLIASFNLAALPPYTRTLRLADNPLRFVPRQLLLAIVGLRELDTLDLSRCRLRAFPSLLHAAVDDEPATATQVLLGHVKELNLRGNCLSSLPNSFRLLTNLEKLDLAYNRFGVATAAPASQLPPEPSKSSSSLSRRSSSSGSVRTAAAVKKAAAAGLDAGKEANSSSARPASPGVNTAALAAMHLSGSAVPLRSRTPVSPPSSVIIVSSTPVHTQHLFRLLGALPALTSLSLAGNGLVHLPPSLLRALSPRLRVLELHDNPELALHHSLARLERLEVLSLSNCPSIKLLPGELFHTRMGNTLTRLHARNCGLGNQPAGEEAALLKRIEQWKKANYGAEADDTDAATDAAASPPPVAAEGEKLFQYWHTARLADNLRLLDLADNGLSVAPSAIFAWRRIEVLHLEVPRPFPRFDHRRENMPNSPTHGHHTTTLTRAHTGQCDSAPLAGHQEPGGFPARAPSAEQLPAAPARANRLPAQARAPGPQVRTTRICCLC